MKEVPEPSKNLQPADCKHEYKASEGWMALNAPPNPTSVEQIRITPTTAMICVHCGHLRYIPV